MEYILDKKIIGADHNLFSFPHGILEIRGISYISKSLLREKLEIDIIAEDFTMETVMTTDAKQNGLLKSNKKTFPSKTIRISKT